MFSYFSEELVETHRSVYFVGRRIRKGMDVPAPGIVRSEDPSSTGDPGEGILGRIRVVEDVDERTVHQFCAQFRDRFIEQHKPTRDNTV